MEGEYLFYFYTSYSVNLKASIVRSVIWDWSLKLYHGHFLLLLNATVTISF